MMKLCAQIHKLLVRVGLRAGAGARDRARGRARARARARALTLPVHQLWVRDNPAL